MLAVVVPDSLSFLGLTRSGVAPLGSRSALRTSPGCGIFAPGWVTIHSPHSQPASLARRTSPSACFPRVSNRANAGIPNTLNRGAMKKMNIPFGPNLCLLIVWLIMSSKCLLAQTPSADRSARQMEYSEFARLEPGDPAAGQTLFNDTQKIACVNCHAINGIEKSGPNLDGIADKYPRQELIKHIMDPNAFIQPGYETATVLTDSGEVVTGRIRLSTRLEVRLLLASGKLQSIKRNQIEDFKSSNVSMMPDNLIDSVSKQEFADLLAYLETLHSSELNAWSAKDTQVTIPREATPIQLVPVHPTEMKFNDPVWVCEVPGHAGQLIVLEHQQGIAYRLDTHQSPPVRHVFLELAQEITYSPNQGLMCLVFHPDYLSNGKYYVKYEVQEAGGVVLTTINERLAAADRLSDSGRPSRRLLSQEQPAFNHNGGCLAFGPDGMLYIAFGDGGPQKDPPGYSQNLGVFHGSILRIDVDKRDPGLEYAIPRDNPFVSRKRMEANLKAETWAFGFREPWRFSFDSLTGDLWVGDVGQTEYEEVCLVHAGENHGWNVYEGFAPFSDEYRRPAEIYSDPILAYPRSLGVSVTGGYVYRGNPNSPYYGAYIFGDYESRKIWALWQSEGELKDLREIGSSLEHIASFGCDSAGNLYMVGYEGTIFRLEL